MTVKECAAIKQSPGCKETISVADFIARIQKQENHNIAICVTPAGESSIANEIMRLQGQ